MTRRDRCRDAAVGEKGDIGVWELASKAPRQMRVINSQFLEIGYAGCHCRHYFAAQLARPTFLVLLPRALSRASRRNLS